MSWQAPPSPDEIRALRGERTRAAFARELGVTPLTIYRWELPEGSNEARRPRGAMAAALRRAAAGATAVRPALRSEDFGSPGTGAAVSLAASAGEDDQRLILPVLSWLLACQWRKAEDELVTLLAAERIRSRAAQVLAGAAFALLHCLGRNDARAAFAALRPALAASDSGPLTPQAELWMHLAAGIVFSSPDGRLFDVGKVNAHVARAEALMTPDTPVELRLLVRVPEITASLLLGVPDLALRAMARLEPMIGASVDPLARVLAMEGQAHAASFGGQVALAAQRFREVAAAAAPLGYALVQARSLTLMAIRHLDETAAPAQVLEVARQGREVMRSARLVPGLHGIFLSRAEGEALVRLGRFDEAEACLRDGLAIADELAWTPTPLLPPLLRLWEYTGNHQALGELGERLSHTVEPLRTQLRGAAAVVEGVRQLVLGSAAGAQEPLERARDILGPSGSLPFLMREVAVYRVAAHAMGERLQDSEQAVREAERHLEAVPSAWSSAMLSRHKGVLLARLGRLEQARQLLQASLATFTLAGDLSESALGRRYVALLDEVMGEPNARERRAASDEELARLRIVPPRVSLAPLEQRAKASPSAAQCAFKLAPAERWAVAIERLAVRGMTPALLHRELVAIASELFGPPAVRLEELDASGQAEILAGMGERSAEESSFEFGDGLGRRLRLVVAEPLPPHAPELLRSFASVAAMAMELAWRRGYGTPPASPAASDESGKLSGFIAASHAMQRLRAEIGRLAASRSTVILTGESGAGKEVVARALHDLSTRASRPFIAFNCAAVPRELFEGQLFGYRKGAFTGATADHPGVIRAANGGTLFLDEIGELPLDVQAKLLRFLENHEVFPLGGQKPIEVDVRVIAATHRDLGQLVRAGQFRQDLFYRLQVVPLRVPPLRERPEDIPALVRHFTRQLAPKGAEPPILGPDALATLAAHPWPGNVRELRNVIERAMAFTPLPPVLTAAHLRFVGETA